LHLPDKREWTPTPGRTYLAKDRGVHLFVAINSNTVSFGMEEPTDDAIIFTDRFLLTLTKEQLKEIATLVERDDKPTYAGYLKNGND
jgi:hypothetical protein